MRKFIFALAFGALLLPDSGFTLGLGEIEVTTALNQELNVSGLAETIAAGDSAMFDITGSAALGARDSDRLDLRIEDANSITFDRPVSLGGTFPLDPAGSFPVDGLVAAQVDVGNVDPSLLAGETRRVSLNVLLPSNGYEDDTLTRIDVQNQGTAENGTDISRVEAWVDDGDDTFDELTDTLLGELTFTGVRWERTGMNVSIPARVGRRVFVTTDLSELATAGRTVQLAIPGAPDFGLAMLSDNDGPLDAPVVSSQQTIPVRRW